MKLDNTTFESATKSVAFWSFTVLAILGIIGVCLGNARHVFTVTACVIMAYAIYRYW